MTMEIHNHQYDVLVTNSAFSKTEETGLMASQPQTLCSYLHKKRLEVMGCMIGELH
jgi:hypothetical protein